MFHVKQPNAGGLCNAGKPLGKENSPALAANGKANVIPDLALALYFLQIYRDACVPTDRDGTLNGIGDEARIAHDAATKTSLRICVGAGKSLLQKDGNVAHLRGIFLLRTGERKARAKAIQGKRESRGGSAQLRFGRRAALKILAEGE